MPILHIYAVGAHIFHAQVAVSALPCCVVAVSRESQLAVREQKGHWGKREPSALVGAVGNDPGAIGALGRFVDTCGEGES